MVIKKSLLLFLISVCWTIILNDITKTNAADFDVKGYILNKMDSYEDNIDVYMYELNGPELEDLMSDIFKENPQLFYVNDSYVYNLHKGIVTDITLSYYENEKNIGKMQKKMDAVIDDIQKEIPDDYSDLEIAKWVHDYLIEKCEYDYQAYADGTIGPNGFSAYGALVENKAVCLGYAKAYQYILNNIFGIECSIATSDIMNHAWNVIEIDEQYFHIDSTWDDSQTTSNEHISQDLFLLSNEEARIKGYKGWSF